MSSEPENRLIDEPEFRELIQTAKNIDVEDAWLDAQLDQILEKDWVTPTRWRVHWLWWRHW